MSQQNDRSARAVQGDRHLRRWKVTAGVVTVLALLALTATSVARAPKDVWTAVLPVAAAVVVILACRRPRATPAAVLPLMPRVDRSPGVYTPDPSRTVVARADSRHVSHLRLAVVTRSEPRGWSV
jgi:hypothetical protein